MHTASISYKDFGGNGPMLHFSHANGYSPECYQRLLTPLTHQFHVIGHYARPLRSTTATRKNIPGWDVFCDDLIRSIESSARDKVYAAGHSMGAIATLMAAAKRPDLFEKIFLLEPVLLSPINTLGLDVLPRAITNHVPVIKKALGRPDTWPSKEAAFEFHRPKRVFSRMTDEALWDYIEHGTVANARGQVTLAYKKELEAHCYSLIPNVWRQIRTCKVPVIGIRGAESDTLTTPEWKRWKMLAPHHRLMEIADATHLLPLEKPAQVSDIILKLAS